MAPPVIITTSWDDGHQLDLKLARLLARHRIAATFYISPRTAEIPAARRLTPGQVRELAGQFEIGAHTLTHPRLSRLPAAAAWQEIAGSKAELEQVTGAPVRSFCYPYGDYSAQTKQLVRRAGFAGARTIRRFATRSADPMAAATSADVFDHRRDGMWPVLRLAGYRPGRALALRRFDALARLMLDRARAGGGVLHLWGHSAEIEQRGLWARLEALLAWLSEQPDVMFARNGELPPPRPRVLIAAPYFPPHPGGLEQYACQIGRALHADRGWPVSVVTSGRPGETGPAWQDGLRVHRLPVSARVSNTPLGWRWPGQLRRLIAAERPDVIVAHGPVPGLLDVAARHGRSIPLVVTYHQDSMVKGRAGADVLVRAYERWVLPRSLRRARAVICASPQVRRWERMAPHAARCTVITPGIDTVRFSPGPARPPGRALLHVGGLRTGEEHKELETSLRVLAALRGGYPGVRLAVAGDGDRQPHFAQLAARLGVGPQVDFLGRLAGDRLVAAYRAADVLLAPSRREAFGMAAAEAMACGVPVVASAVGGLAELVRPGRSGLLAAPGDVAVFAAAVRELLDDPRRHGAMGRAARRDAEAGARSWAAQARRTAGLIESVL